MHTLNSALDVVASRGARFAVIGTIRPGETRAELVVTAAQAEKVADLMREEGLRNVRLYLPQSEADYKLLGRKLSDVRRELADVTQECKAAAHRLTESGISEVETANQLGVDRMTVRSWLGKR